MGQRYREVQIATESPLGLVVRMYEAAIASIQRARAHHRHGEVYERGHAISKALAIVGELRQSLDHEKGGAIARNLESLYDFVLDRLLEVNLRGRAEAFDEALRVLDTLRKGWTELSQRGIGVAGGP